MRCDVMFEEHPNPQDVTWGNNYILMQFRHLQSPTLNKRVFVTV